MPLSSELFLCFKVLFFSPQTTTVKFFKSRHLPFTPSNFENGVLAKPHCNAQHVIITVFEFSFIQHKQQTNHPSFHYFTHKLAGIVCECSAAYLNLFVTSNENTSKTKRHKHNIVIILVPFKFVIS